MHRVEVNRVGGEAKGSCRWPSLVRTSGVLTVDEIWLECRIVNRSKAAALAPLIKKITRD